MDKKNYISREEYKIWEYISDKDIINSELILQIFPEMSRSKKSKILHNLCKKGYINRMQRDLYYNPEKLKDFYKLALKIKTGYIGLGSALNHYKLIDYENFTIFIITKNYRKKIPIKGAKYEFQFMPFGKLFNGFEKKDGIYISSIEKTLFDCLLKPNFVGYSNITKAFYNAKIDWKKFIDFFKLDKNNALCQRTGYMLELIKKKTKIKIPNFVFEFLLKNVKNPVKLLSIKGRSVFNNKWKVQDNIGEKNLFGWWY